MKGKALTDKLARLKAGRRSLLPKSRRPTGNLPRFRLRRPRLRQPSSRQPRHHSTIPKAGQARVAKPDTQVPPMPASDLGDQRRAVITL